MIYSNMNLYSYKMYYKRKNEKNRYQNIAATPIGITCAAVQFLVHIFSAFSTYCKNEVNIGEHRVITASPWAPLRRSFHRNKLWWPMKWAEPPGFRLEQKGSPIILNIFVCSPGNFKILANFCQMLARITIEIISKIEKNSPIILTIK